MELREQKGLEIANRFKITQHADRWFVPSQSGRTGISGGGHCYTVKPDVSNPHCNCPDHETYNGKCKHIFAVEFLLQGALDDKGEIQDFRKKIGKKKTYPQQWPAYNKAQTQEKENFQTLLRELCTGIGEPSQKIGRPRLPFEEMIFAATFKVYSTVSQRRFMSDLRDAHAKGHISKVPHFNSISNYLESEVLTPYLEMLIEESALPLKAIESDFAVDSSGFSTCRFVQWVEAKYTNPQLMTKREWVKVHLMCGVKTNVVTSVKITDRYSADSPQFKQLVDDTAKNFVMQEVSADKAYLSAANLQTVVDPRCLTFHSKAIVSQLGAWVRSRRTTRMHDGETKPISGGRCITTTNSISNGSSSNITSDQMSSRHSA
jgi:hypothetical protein